MSFESALYKSKFRYEFQRSNLTTCFLDRKKAPVSFFIFIFIYFDMSRMTNHLFPKTQNSIPKTFSAEYDLHNTFIIEYSESYYVLYNLPKLPSYIIGLIASITTCVVVYVKRVM